MEACKVISLSVMGLFPCLLWHVFPLLIFKVRTEVAGQYVCDYVDFLWVLLLTSAEGGGSGVWATEPVADLWLCWPGCLG